MDKTERPITAIEVLGNLIGPAIAAGVLAFVAYVHSSLVLLIFAIILWVSFLVVFVLTIVVFKRRARERHG